MNETKNQKWYEKWHSGEYHIIIHWGIFLVAVVAAYAFLSAQINDWRYDLTATEGVAIHLVTASAYLTLSPHAKTMNVGDTFSADIILNTGNTPVDGVDIYSLRYQPDLLEVIDDMPNKSGVQITPGSIMALNAANTVSAKFGTIKFSQVAEGGHNFIGKGTLATVHFKAISPGTAYLKFDFTKGSTIDSNAAYQGKDRLVNVVDATYTIKAKE